MVKSYIKISLFALAGISFIYALQEQQAPKTAQSSADSKSTHVQKKSSKKLILFGVKGSGPDSGLLYADMSRVKGGSLGALFGITPEAVQAELFSALQPLYINNLKNYTSTYPMIIEAWLTNQMTNQAVQYYAVDHIKKSCGFMKKMRLKPAAEIAFSPYDAAQALSINHSMVTLAQNCKNKGHVIAVCSSWNSESFDAVKRTHYAAFTPFEKFYISGNCGMLACEKRFYDQFLKEYALEDIYLIDSLQENLAAAHKRGIKTIFCSSAQAVEYELSKQGIL